MPKSYYLANVNLNANLRDTPQTPAAVIYVALYTVMPTAAGGGTEVSGGSYARSIATFASPVNGALSNDAEVLFPTASADWGTIVGYAYHDAVGAGNMLYFAALSSSRLVQTSDIVRYPAGMLVVTEA